MKSQELLNEQYKDLVAQLGDAKLKIKKLEKHAQELENQIEAIDKVAPILFKIESELKNVK